MADKKKTLAGNLLDLTIGAAVAGPALTELEAANIPSSLKTGTQSLIGVGLLKGASELGEDKKKRRLL